MDGTKVKPAEILLVEDNPGDARLIQEAFLEGRCHNRVTILDDGSETLAYLRREGKHNNAVLPDLILLDLNMPKKDGRELLKELKEDPDFRRIPIIILTTSKVEEDILRSYELHANCYIAKPVEMNQFIDVVKTIEGFWLTLVKLPEN